MSTQPTDLNDEDTNDDDNADLPEPARKRLRALEKENKRIATLESENAALKQQNAIRTAGLGELNDTQLKALNATHEGESTPEALRKTAETLGFAQPIPESNPEDVAAHQALADARTGANKVGDTSYEEEVRTAKSRDELKAIAQKHNRPWAE